MTSFAERFQRALDCRNMKQSDIVRRTKIGKSSISTYLSGEYEPKQRNVYKIAEALGVNAAWLMGYDVPMEASLDATGQAIPYVRGRRIPILGAVPAGVPVLATENIEGYDYADVPEGEDYFFLRVKGDSMINAKIYDGDLVLIKMQPSADDGQVVACIVNGEEATLKRFRRQDDVVILQPENSNFRPVVVPYRDFESGYARIMGVATEVRHKL